MLKEQGSSSGTSEAAVGRPETYLRKPPEGRLNPDDRDPACLILSRCLPQQGAAIQLGFSCSIVSRIVLHERKVR